MNQIFRRSALAVAVLIGINVIILPSISSAATKVDLGASSSFGVLASTTVTNAATATTITGTAGNMVGVTPGSSVTGTGTLTAGTIVTGLTAPAPAAMIDAQAAYTSGRLQTPTIPFIPGDLGGGTVLTAGAYNITNSPETLTGNLTLDGGNNPAAVFIFDTAAALTTASGSTVTLTNGAQACNVFWLIGSAATLGTGSTFVGHIIANTGVVATSGAHIAGSLTSLTASVTLDNNLITNDNCAAVVPAPVLVQTSRIDSVTPATCVTSGPTKVTLNGLFPTAVANVTVNGVSIPKTDWVQTPSTVVVTSRVQTNAPLIIQLYNGAVPLLAVQTFICTPIVVVPPVVVVVVPPVPTIATGTIHLVKVVNNAYGGTATPGDFMLSLRHHGVDVVGSPAAGVGGDGRTYVVPAGTYVVSEPNSVLFPDYIHFFNINGQTTQSIVLAAGQSITVTQTNTQLPPLTPVVTPTTPPAPPPPPTVTGGKLPKTSSPWFNLLFFGIGGMVLGGVMLGRKRSTQN